MSWDDIAPRVHLLLDGRLDADAEATLLSELDADPELKRRYAELKAVVGGLREFRNEGAPAGFQDRFRAALSADDSARSPVGNDSGDTSSPVLSFSRWAGPIAAAVCLTATAWMLMGDRDRWAEKPSFDPGSTYSSNSKLKREGWSSSEESGLGRFEAEAGIEVGLAGGEEPPPAVEDRTRAAGRALSGNADGAIDVLGERALKSDADEDQLEVADEQLRSQMKSTEEEVPAGRVVEDPADRPNPKAGFLDAPTPSAKAKSPTPASPAPNAAPNTAPNTSASSNAVAAKKSGARPPVEGKKELKPLAQVSDDEDSNVDGYSNDDSGALLETEKSRKDRGRSNSVREAEESLSIEEELEELADAPNDRHAEKTSGIGDAIRSVIDELTGAFGTRDEAPASAAAVPRPAHDDSAAFAKLADRSTSDRLDTETRTIFLRVRPKAATNKGDPRSAVSGGVTNSLKETWSERVRELDGDADKLERDAHLEATRLAMFALPESFQRSIAELIGADPDRVDIMTVPQADVAAWIGSLSPTFEVRALNSTRAGVPTPNEAGKAESASTRGRKVSEMGDDLDWIGVPPPERYDEIAWDIDAERLAALAESITGSAGTSMELERVDDLADKFVQDGPVSDDDMRGVVDSKKGKSRQKTDASDEESKGGAASSLAAGKKKGDAPAAPDSGSSTPLAREPATESRSTELAPNAGRVRVVVIYEDH